MAKPVILYQFDTNGTHVVTPTSDHQSDGWANNEKPGSGEVNGFWQNWTAWLAYLQAGNMEGNWHFAGNVDIVGTVLFENTVEFEQAVTMDTTLGVTGVATVGGLKHTDKWEIPTPIFLPFKATNIAISGSSPNFHMATSGAWELDVYILGVRIDDLFWGFWIDYTFGNTNVITVDLYNTIGGFSMGSWTITGDGSFHEGVFLSASGIGLGGNTGVGSPTGGGAILVMTGTASGESILRMSSLWSH